MNFTQEDNENQKKLIGDFFIKFDQAISTISFAIPQLIFKRQCTAKEQRNIETLLSDLTASSIRNKFDSLLADNYSESKDLIMANAKLSSAMGKIAEFRNSFAHGSYRLGWSDFDGGLDKGYFSLRHSKATKKGYEKRSKIYKISEIQNLNEQLLVVFNSYIKLSSIFLLDNLNKDYLDMVNMLTADVASIGQVQFRSTKESN